VDTTVCEILKNPQSFNGKIVRVKGTAVASFDQFAVKGTGCDTTVNNNIWLSYPEGTKAKAGPAVMVRVQPAHNFAGEVPTVQRTPVELDKSSKDFKQFDSLLATPYKKGGMCLGCNRYEVTATLVGRLDAAESTKLHRDKAGKIIGFGGFGHMNAYSARLVLQSVSDVTPKEIDYSKTLAATKDDTAPDQSGMEPLEAAQKLAETSSPTMPAGIQFKRAVEVFGKPKENNGVVIQHGNGNDAAAKYEAKGTVDSPDGLLYTCTINTNRVSGDAESRAIVFAGENIANLRIPLPEGLDAGIYDLENRAWTTTTLDAVGSRQKTMTLPGAYLLWNLTWTPADINKNVGDAIEGFLTNEELLHK
jgi:hypothetical protein